MLACASAIFLLPIAGQSSTAPAPASVEDPNADALWAGEYKGVIPSADGLGIQMVLTLSVDGSFKKVATLIEKETLPYVTDGKIEWIEKGKRFRIHDPYREELYELDGGSLYVLDTEGKRIQGKIGSYYVLHKVASLPADHAGKHASQPIAAVPVVPAWCGVYEGTLPAADCEGILVQLTLNADMTFKQVTVYLGVQDEEVANAALVDLKEVFRSVEESLPDVQEGTLDWSDDEKTLVVHTEDGQESYELDKDGLHMLNADGQRVTGPLAPFYVLKKAGSETGPACKSE